MYLWSGPPAAVRNENGCCSLCVGVWGRGCCSPPAPAWLVAVAEAEDRDLFRFQQSGCSFFCSSAMIWTVTIVIVTF